MAKSVNSNMYSPISSPISPMRSLSISQLGRNQKTIKCATTIINIHIPTHVHACHLRFAAGTAPTEYSKPPQTFADTNGPWEKYAYMPSPCNKQQKRKSINCLPGFPNRTVSSWLSLSALICPIHLNMHSAQAC